jgi:HSP20 family molecular chaperone IbpA
VAPGGRRGCHSLTAAVEKEVRTVFDFWDEIAIMERRMDDLVREFLGTRTRLAYPALPLFVHKPFVPTLDVFRRDEDLVVRLEVPGIDPEKDVHVKVLDRVLVIEGERTQQEKVEEGAYYRMEASYGAFKREIPIPEGIGEDTIKATYTDGVLEVIVPNGAAQLRPVEGRQIPVKAVTTTKAA